MVIQRIQTLFLLIAVVLLTIFCFVPYGYMAMVENATGEEVQEALVANNLVGLWLPVVVAGLLALAGIFLYKRFAAQRLCVVLSMVSTLAAILVVVYVLVSGFHDPDPEVGVGATAWGGGGLLLVAALIAEIAALRAIVADHKLLKSLDRIR